MTVYGLRVLDGPTGGLELEVTGLLEVGREAGLGLSLEDDALASGRHARLYPSPDGLILEDLGSLNGTCVNGALIEAPTLVRPGDRILVGDTTLEVRGGAAAAGYALRVFSSDGSVRELPLDGALEIGRDPGLGLPLVEDDLVSRRHAQLTPQPGGVLLEDLGSSNGTSVNGRRIDGATLLVAGDRFLVGLTTIAIESRRTETPQVIVPLQGFTSNEADAAQAEGPETLTSKVIPLATDEQLLEVIGDQGPPQEVHLRQPIRVGRDPAVGLPLEDDVLVSWAHASLSPVSEGVSVADLGSHNGTFVNGVKVEGPTLARPGDVILIGDTTIVVRES